MVAGPARIVIQLLQGDVVVHEFRRATSQPTSENIRKMTETAAGWMQAWSGQLGDEQWRRDVARATEAQAPPD